MIFMLIFILGTATAIFHDSSVDKPTTEKERPETGRK